MKQQVLTQKISALVLSALFIYCIHGTSYADLEFAEDDTTTREIAENASRSTNIGAPVRYSVEPFDSCIEICLRGPDASSFAIAIVSPHGVQLRTKSRLNYEKKNSYEVTLTISDTESTDTDTITVNIIVTDVNEAPVFSEQMDAAAVNRVHRSIPENTQVGINIGPPVSATDPDGSEVVLTYSLRGYDAAMFEIDNGTGQLRTKMPLDYEAFAREPRTYFVEVEVSDGSASSKTEVWIDVEPVNEFAPMFVEGDTVTHEINETAKIGVSVGEPLTATDMDAGETLEYSLGDADTGAFEVDSRTGQLRTIAELDYTTKPIHTVKVIVSDGSRTDSIIVTIHVLNEIVEIPDRSLAWAIRRALGLSDGADITKRAMSGLTTLRADSELFRGRSKPSDLTGLEHATNLTHLNLNGSTVADLTPIAGLRNLISLRLYSNQLSSLTPLEDLTSLKSLDLSANRISDITSLKGLTNLVELFIQLNEIQDVTPLKGMTNLETLYLSENNVEDITALEGLTNLTRLYLQANSIQDITPLKGMTNLETLYLTNNDIEDITALEGLTNLKYLHLTYNRRLTDVSPLAGLVNLEILRLFGCPIEDTTPLANLTADIDINVSSGSAPPANGDRIDSLLDLAVLKTLDRDMLQTRLQELRVESDGSLRYQRAIAMLESVLASMRPDKTVLLSNYPNPFNPETWIPYHLAKAANVQIPIYNARGTVIRHLRLGHQSAGYYTSRSLAAYWDGKNDFGERVANGIYFYQLQADTISPLRKMVILK